MSTMKCPECGASIPENSKFCLECGAKIEVSIKKEKKYSPGPLHYTYGNNQSCGGKSNIVVRNGFIYYIKKAEATENNITETRINVSPISDEDMIQTLYVSKGPDSTAACLNMVEDELIFYEYADGDKITALNIYTGTRRIIIEGHKADSIWIENGIITFVESFKLKSINLDGTEFYEYEIEDKISDRIIGYNGNLYAKLEESGEIIEIPYYSSEYRNMEIISGNDMIYAIIGNLYYSPAPDEKSGVLLCKEIPTLRITNGVQEIDRMITAFEQYVIFSRENEKEYSFAWNVQTLRVYKLNRYIDFAPYAFTQILSDYLIVEDNDKLYKVPAPVFFQGTEPMFETDKFLFAEL